MAIEHPNGRSLPGNPLPTGPQLDDLIDRQTASFLDAPREVRNAAAVLWRIVLQLAPDRALALVAHALRLLDEQRIDHDGLAEPPPA
jgi:hypothetical protein